MNSLSSLQNRQCREWVLCKMVKNINNKNKQTIAENLEMSYMPMFFGLD